MAQSCCACECIRGCQHAELLPQQILSLTKRLKTMSVP